MAGGAHLARRNGLDVGQGLGRAVADLRHGISEQAAVLLVRLPTSTRAPRRRILREASMKLYVRVLEMCDALALLLLAARYGTLTNDSMEPLFP